MQTTQSSYAIIILNFFGFEDSVSCIRSVRKSSKSVVFLVDNSANENEKEKLEQTFGNDPGIQLIFPQENLGFAAGVNLGLRQALKTGHRHFLLLNNDAVLPADAMDIFAKAFKKHPGSIISPAIMWGGRPNKGNYYQKYLGLKFQKPFLKELGSLYYFSGCALGFDKEVLDKIGFLDESFFFYGEDVEFSYRAQKNNIPLILLPELLVTHEGNKSSRAASLFYEYYLNHSHLLLTSKIIDNPIKKVIAYIGKSLFLCVRAIIRSFRYSSILPLWAFLLGPFSFNLRPRTTSRRPI